MTILIIISVYISSCFTWWLYLHKAYSFNGIWKSIDPATVDIILIFIPIINTILSVGWIFYYPIESDRDWNDFLKIKRHK